MEVKLSQLIAPPFYPVHKAIKNETHDEIWLKGGRASTKSSFAAIELVLGIMKNPTANALCLRKVSNTIRTSVQENILWAIDMLGVTQYWDTKVSPAEVTYKPTGQKIIFKGLDKARKLKSIKLRTGYFKYTWFEELEEFEGMEEIRNVIQSIKRGGEGFVTIFSFNPPDDLGSWVNIEVQVPVEGRIVHHSTYLDVPVEWLGKEAIEEADKLKKRDNDKYRHEYLGEVIGRTDKIVFNGKWRVEECSPKYTDTLYYGMDFGFANDPTVAVRAWVDEVKREIYVDYSPYAHQLEIDDHHSLLDGIPDSDKHTIRGDSSRPETISYIRRQGFDIVPCKKSMVVDGKKTKSFIIGGIEWLRSFTIVVHPRCKLLQKELRLHSYVVDKNGNVTPKLEDKHCDVLDSLRYCLEPFILNQGYEEPQAAPELHYDFGADAFMG